MRTAGTDLCAQTQYYLYRDLQLELLCLINAYLNWTQRQLAKVPDASLGKINDYVRAPKERGLEKWDNFSQSPHKLAYLHTLIPQGIAHKQRLTAHFLQRKEAKCEMLQAEIAVLLEECILMTPVLGGALISRTVRLGRLGPGQCVKIGPHLKPSYQWRVACCLVPRNPKAVRGALRSNLNFYKCRMLSSEMRDEQTLISTVDLFRKLF